MNTFDMIHSTLNVDVIGRTLPSAPEQGTYNPVNKDMILVWSAGYDDLDPYYQHLSVLVSADEAWNAAGFKKPEDAQRYILRHGMVRAILGHYTHQDPAKVRLIKGRYGRPYLDPGNNGFDVQFSLSHTDEMICLGVTQKNEIGLDIVKINPHYPFLAVEQYLFTPGEREWITQTAPEKRTFQFFRIWSLKEALLKAMDSDVRMMKEADVSGIMTGSFLNGLYPVHIGKTDLRFFIYESGYGKGHYGVLAAV
jgi:4'-phosphopantetheinyl transferase